MKKHLFYFVALGPILSGCAIQDSVYETFDALERNRQAIDRSTYVIYENIQAIEQANASIQENRRQLEEINKTLKKAGESQ
jgi:hypothetical protein